jgi:DNA replication and repair protein RecF
LDSQLYLKEIKLFHFKNYGKANFEFIDGINIITGLNGVGKTNLLDAIYILGLTKSYFMPNDRYLVQHEKKFYRIEGNWIKNTKKLKVAVKYTSSYAKQIDVNGKAGIKPMEHIGQIPIVLISPNDLELVSGLNEIRRRFMDITISQIDPNYLENLVTYIKVQKLRNALLTKSLFFDQIPLDLLESYELKLAHCGEFIHKSRLWFLQIFQPKFSEFYYQISGGLEDVSLRYTSDLETKNYLDLLKNGRNKDFEKGRTVYGIHRDKMALFIKGQPLQQEASQGQLKSFVLALKLAQYSILQDECKFNPILLLDDIFDKIDASRVGHILSMLSKDDFGQIFITDTHVDRVAHLLEELKLNVNFKEMKIEKSFDNLQIDPLN